MTLRAPIIAALLVALPAPGSAQEQNPPSGLPQMVSVGSRVRLTSSAFAGRAQGLIVAIDNTVVTVVADQGGLPVKVPVGSITSLETSLGRRRHTLQGLGIGAAAGLLSGLTYSVDPNDCGGYYSTNFCSRGDALGVGALGGGLIGTIVGALIQSDRWAPVSLTLTPPHARGGRAFGLQVAVRF